jgi:hypothetical protein
MILGERAVCWSESTMILGERAVRWSESTMILGERHMECAYYFYFCGWIRLGRLGLAPTVRSFGVLE